LKKYTDESLEILIHETSNFAQKLGPFFISNDSSVHIKAKYILNKICTKDPHNAQVLQKFIETYNEKDRNISKDGSESLHLSDLN
jgi:hypothetical protein